MLFKIFLHKTYCFKGDEYQICLDRIIFKVCENCLLLKFFKLILYVFIELELDF